MRFHEQTKYIGDNCLKKTFAWLPTKVGSCTVWFEYYWHHCYWDSSCRRYIRNTYYSNFNKLLEEHNE